MGACKRYTDPLNFVIVVVLWTGCFAQWINILTREQINPFTWMDCKLFFFIFYFGRHFSSMLLVLMSVEKCFAVYFPFTSRTVCTVRTAKWATGIVGVFLVGYNIFQIWDWQSRFIKSIGHHICIFIDENNKNILYAVDSVLYSFGPFVLMFITNFAIVFKFMRAKCRSNSTESTNQALVKSATRGQPWLLLFLLHF